MYISFFNSECLALHITSPTICEWEAVYRCSVTEFSCEVNYGSGRQHNLPVHPFHLAFTCFYYYTPL